MENPINTLQGRIIYLTGQIVLHEKECNCELSIKHIRNECQNQIEQHKQAIRVLAEKQPTTSSNLDLNDIRLSLPKDTESDKEAERRYSKTSKDHGSNGAACGGFIAGARWMREKIKEA